MRMRALSCVVAGFLAAAGWASGAVLTNADFEAGSLVGWAARAGPLTVGVTTNDSFNRNYSAVISGKYASATWITNGISQTFKVRKGDAISVDGFVKWSTYTAQNASATGYVQACLLGGYNTNQTLVKKIFTTNNGVWTYFNVSNQTFGPVDGGFEQSLTNWIVGASLYVDTQASNVDKGAKALIVSGNWTNWGWNEIYQVVNCVSGETVQAKGRVMAKTLRLGAGGDWLVAGIKLEQVGGGQGVECSLSSTGFPTNVWTDLAFTMVATNTAPYVYRCMVAGGTGGSNNGAEVYFDNISLTCTGVITNVTLDVSFIAHSGLATATSSVQVALDAFTMKGSLANVPPATNILTGLNAEALQIGTNSAAGIPPVVYPPIYTYGAPAAGTYPSYIETATPGWIFQYFTNSVNTIFTNTITLSADTNGPGTIEFDQLIFCAKNANVGRGQPLVISTNAPYFTLGANDNLGSEFGAGPFPATATYVQGMPLSNFPRRMTTDASSGWPSALNIVVTNFNFSQFDHTLYNLHWVLDTIATNGASLNTKVAKLLVNATKNGVSNDVQWKSQDLHMGYASVTSCYGLVDYANVTYQDANQVAVRTPWLYNLVDDGTGWFMQQSPRASATIEPMDLFASACTNWVQRMYEEALFTWPNAASGVRSIFDGDSQVRLAGAASYHIGFKVGHAWGTNDLGQPNYPEVLNLRGNGYFRMADFDGVMAGSFRPVAADVFGFYKGKKAEDFPLIPKAYAQVVPRTTATNLPDDSYGRAFMQFRSKTNQAFIGSMEADMHFSPDEASTNGAWFDLSVNNWSHRGVTVTNDGMLALFSQVSMHWRGTTNYNDATEGHDVDVVMVKKADGEWVTHQVLNPPTNVVHRTLASVASNDVIYIMQQDRGDNSYPFATESPYRRASSFEITLLNDAGQGLNLDVDEEHTDSEVNDNVNILCNITNNIAQGQKLAYAYRYRAQYAPGVYLYYPNETGGAENWSNDTYTIDFIAIDGNDKPLTANLYYGNGRDSNWTAITTVSVPTNTHRVTYNWNTAGVSTGAYYIKVTAQRTAGGKTGFDLSNTRLQVSRTAGLPSNGVPQTAVTTNLLVLGADMSFETGSMTNWNTSRTNWNSGGDDLGFRVTNSPVFDGQYAARMVQTGAWNGWGWNNIFQEVPCLSGEVLHVTGKVFIKNLTKTGTSWLVCGVKMESTNGAAYTSSGVEFDQAATTGSWLNVDFTRTAPVTGTDRLLLWCGGYDGSNIDVLYDNIAVVSTNGPVVTNTALNGYWVNTNGIDVSAHKVLTFWVAGTNNARNLRVWARDKANVTNAVYVTNYVNALASVPQRVDIPWSVFASINRTQLVAVGFFYASPTNDVRVSRMRSHTPPLIVRSQFRSAPRVDAEGMPLYFPGEVVTNIVTITNLTATAATGVTIQVDQEYGEDRTWTDTALAPSFQSAQFRRGDRLEGPFEQRWINQTIPANGTLTLTNVYASPVGRLITSTSAPSFYVDRNIQGRAQVHLAVRKTSGDTCCDNDAAGAYSVDDDTNTTNNTYSGAFIAGGGAVKASLPSGGGAAATTASAPSATRSLASFVSPVLASSAKAAQRNGQAAVTAGSAAGVLFADDFNDGNYNGWVAHADPNIQWSVRGGALQAEAVGKGGYAYLTAKKVDIQPAEFTIEYDTRFDNGAYEGGIIFRDRALYVSPGLCGWADANPDYGLGYPVVTTGVWQHVILDVRSGGKGGQVSDLYVDGHLIFADEPIETDSKPSGIGLLSPYHAGTVSWDNLRIEKR